MNDKQWDDYITRREGTIFGDIANNNHKNAMKPPEQYYFPPKVAPPKPVQKKVASSHGDELSPLNKTNSSFSFILMLIGFVFGIYYSEATGIAALGSGLIFAILAGLIIPIVKFILKIVAFAIQLGVILFIIYLIAKIIGSA
jgi:hypothetical protein